MVMANDEKEDLSDPKWRASHQHEFGRRLMPTLIDDRARLNHARPYACIPRTKNPNDGYRDVTYRQFARAINRCAQWIKDQIGTSDRFEPVLYIGSQDLRYQIIAMAGAKTGHAMFFISTRNSLDAQVSLIDKAEVTKILVTADPATEALVKPILQERQLNKIAVPELDYFLEEIDVEHFPFTKSFDEYRMKPWIMLHTSGSTGLPKVVTIKHGYTTTSDALWHSPNGNDIFKKYGHKRLFNPFPLFHVGGMVSTTAISIFADSTVILPPLAPLNAEIVNSVHVHARVDVSMLPSALIVELAKDESYLKNLKSLHALYYGGGPLPKSIGDKVIKDAKIYTYYGATEMHGPPMLENKSKDWDYFKFDLDYSGIEFQQFENTDLYECVIIRDPSISLVQAVFITYPDIDEYHTKDLFSKHPTEQGLWKYEGRLDDVLVFTTGEMVNPVDMEGAITTSPDVTGALVVGQGRFQAALLLEVKTMPSDNHDKKKLLDSIWPHIQKANDKCPNYARISRDLVYFIDPKKPFARAGKGTIQRQTSVKLYEEEIDKLYAEHESKGSSTNGFMVNFANQEETQKFLQDWFAHDSRLGMLSPETELFTAGMDSLEVFNLVRKINAHASGTAIQAKQIYDNPTIKLLSESLTKPQASTEEGGGDTETWNRMQQVFDENFAQISAEQQRNETEERSTHGTTNGVPWKHVVLTGSTGSLGSYLLNELLEDQSITKVTCLNRSSNASERQLSQHTSRGLTTMFPTSRVEFLTCDLTRPDLGLGLSDHQSLLHTTTHVIHNAWTVDFNYHFRTFEPQVRGVTHLINFVLSCESPSVRLFFMSSVGTAANWSSPEPVPESVLEDWSLSEKGYGQSKLVAERLIAEATKRNDLDAVIFRVGQVAGPVSRGLKGEWNRAEWLPALVQSSKAMGVIPEALGPSDRIDWIPVDLVAKICIELAMAQYSPTNVNGGSGQEVKVWQIVNPNATAWNALLPSVVKVLNADRKPEDHVKSTSFVEWVDELGRESAERTNNEDRDLSDLPAAKLLAFFDYWKGKTEKAVFDTTYTTRKSETLRTLEAVKGDWAELWVRQWEF